MQKTTLPKIENPAVKTVAVLMGGWSNEHDVSMVSGSAVAKGLRHAGYNVQEIVVGRDLNGLVEALSYKPDVVFNALHGIGGEDGRIQSVLDILNLKYTHSKHLASAIAMDKQKSKAIVATYGVRIARGHVLRNPSLNDFEKKSIKPPLVIKPNQEGSSVGVYIIKEGDNRLEKILADWNYGEALVEKYIPGRELTVSVMSGENGSATAMTVTEITAKTDFYDYEAKYSDGGSVHILPADIPEDVFKQAMEWAELSHIALGCGGVTRTDFRYDDSQTGTNGLYYLETNTQPGMTPTSLVPEQAAYCGMPFDELVQWMVETAYKD